MLEELIFSDLVSKDVIKRFQFLMNQKTTLKNGRSTGMDIKNCLKILEKKQKRRTRRMKMMTRRMKMRIGMRPRRTRRMTMRIRMI